MLTETPSKDLLDECWITTDAEEMSSRFDREHFEITHTLAEHPLLQIPELMELAERTTKTRPEGIYYDAGNIRIDTRGNKLLSHERKKEERRNTKIFFVYKKNFKKRPRLQRFSRGRLEKDQNKNRP